MMFLFDRTCSRSVTSYLIVASGLALSERLLAKLGQRGRRRDGLGIDFQMHDRRLAGGLCGPEGAGKVVSLLHGDAEAAECTCIGGKIRVLEHGGRHATRIFALLMHAD